MIKTPNLAFVTENTNLNIRCEDLSKALLVLWYINKKEIKIFGQEELKEIMENIFMEIIGRFKSNLIELNEFFEHENIVNLDTVLKVLENNNLICFSDFEGVGDLRIYL